MPGRVWECDRLDCSARGASVLRERDPASLEGDTEGPASGSWGPGRNLRNLAPFSSSGWVPRELSQRPGRDPVHAQSLPFDP